MAAVGVANHQILPEVDADDQNKCPTGERYPFACRRDEKLRRRRDNPLEEPILAPFNDPDVGFTQVVVDNWVQQELRSR